MGGTGYIPVTSPTPLLKSVLLIMISTNINNSNTDNDQVFSLSELRDRQTDDSMRALQLISKFHASYASAIVQVFSIYWLDCVLPQLARKSTVLL